MLFRSRLVNKLFKDPTGSYSMMTDFPQYGMLTDDINKALPKNKLKNQVVIEFRPDTLSGIKDENGEYKAFDSSFKSIEKMTIHNPGASMNVFHPEAIEGADMVDKFFTMGLNPDKSHVYSLRRSRTESEKASHREKLSKEYLDHINSQRGKLKYTYHKKIDKGLNDLQQILDKHEKLGPALQDILARIEKAIANNEYSPVDRVYPGGGPGEIYNGNDPALKGQIGRAHV